MFNSLSSSLVCLGVVLRAVQAAPGQLAAGPIVDLKFGKYRGLYNASSNTNSWYKIPYAVPPTGTLRWHAPQPIESRDPWGAGFDVTDASRPGPSCVQGHPAWQWSDFQHAPDARGSEDCLHVNIMAPATIDKAAYPKGLPVLVKIHGGGYVQGSADLDDGFALMKHSRGGLIFVSMQYRLGVLGFLGSDEVKEDGVANAGLLDQRLAMQWVQKYIGTFGGDAEKIVVDGGNAGGGSVGLHLMMFGGSNKKLPFQGAIADWPMWQSFHDRDVTQAQYRHLLHAANCANITCLRELPDGVMAAAAQQVYTHGYFAQPNPYYGYGDYYFGPTVDGKTIQGLPSKEFKEGRFTTVPILITRDKYEGYLMTNASIKTETELLSDLKRVFPIADNAFFNEILKLYPAKDYESAFFRREAIIGDLYTNCPSSWILSASSKKQSGTWKLLFNAGSQLQGATAEYIFDPTFEQRAGPNKSLAGYMKDWMISFVRNLDPNRESWLGLAPGARPNWPIYGEESDILQVTDDSIDSTTDTDIGSKCDFWQAHSDFTRI